MVLADLGKSLTSALQNLTKAPTIDEQTLDACLKDIGTALLKHDVNVRIISDLKNKIKKAVQSETNPDANKAKVIQKAVFDNLVGVLTPAKEPYQLKKGRTNVVMFVGLQGAGKTTTCTKLAHLWRRKGWKTALVCADTFRAGAFDQLKQNAAKAKIPFYGSDSETDPAKIAANGVAEFKSAGYDVIIVDTSGRHMQEAALFDEMRQVAAAVKPDEVIYVMDSHIGQKSEDQAKAFAASVSVGSVILTKLDGHAKGGGALSAVAATGSPISFIGTGEHFDDLEAFDPRGFVSKLLGMGDIKGLMNTMKDAISEEDQQSLINNIQKGKFTFRMMAEQMRSVLKMGPMAKLAQMAGMGAMANILDSDIASRKMRGMISIFDSMTPAELDGDMDMVDESRLRRIARGSGMKLTELKITIAQQKSMAKMISGMGKLTQAAQGGGKPGKMSNSMQQQMASMQNMMKSSGLDMQKLQQQMRTGTPQQKMAAAQKIQAAMEGNDNMSSMMSNMMGAMGMPSMPGMPGGMGGMPGMGGMGGMPDMSALMNMMGGGAGGPGGAGGMPDMSALMNMMGGGAGGAGGGLASLLGNLGGGM